MSGERTHSLSQRLALAVLPPLLGLAVRALATTWRVRLAVPPRSHPRTGDAPLVYAMWHECVITVVAQWRDHPIQGLASQSFDGALIAKTLRHLGYPEASRGSSSRGGAEALRSHVQALKEGRHVVVTVDGPRGPAYQAKPGVLSMARESGRPVVAVACACDARWRLKSWDRTLLPPPFARVVFALSQPMDLGTLDPPAAMAALLSALQAAQVEAEQLLSRYTKPTVLE
ncbi:MAG TPA: lysophospholipid acyltransferase family protein [bacterium]|jgi:lysophospholipid acyltransferase (LPLAT)-like uncharacterized protein|nr:lysophospholipid acyltransferase family protein [bacterium]